MLVLNDFNTSVERALSEIDPKWRDYEGLIVCGTHTPRNVEYMIDKITEARRFERPFLGICFGYQLATIEYARNVTGVEDATSAEFDNKGTFVVIKRPELVVGLKDGESYWSSYTVDRQYALPKLPNYFVAAFHPEYQSMKGKPHPLLVDFLNYAKSK